MEFQNRSTVICHELDRGRVARGMSGSAFLAAAAISLFAAGPAMTAQAQTSQTQTGQTPGTQAPAIQTPSSQSSTNQAPTGQTSMGQSSMGQSTTAQSSAGQPQSNRVHGRDTLFVARTGPQGACPGMDWHVVVRPDNTVNGVVSWDGSKRMAHLTGTLDANGALTASAVENGTNKSDAISGTVQGNDMKASISGTGTPCDNETMNVPKAANGVSHG
jgi:hypothetical protein